LVDCGFSATGQQKRISEARNLIEDFFSIYGFFQNLGYQNLQCSFDILGFRRFSRSTFSMQIYTNDGACCDERASEPLFVSSSVVAAGLVVFLFRRFHDRLSSAASDDEEEETRNF
jgi:hypothetical protein